MAPETLPVLRCESRRRRPEPRWGLVAAIVVLMASTLDALWLVPAQQEAIRERDRAGAAYRCGDAPTPAPTPTPKAKAAATSRTAHVKVEGVYLMKPVPRD